MSIASRTNTTQSLETLLGLPAAARPAWLDAHRAACTLELITALKEYADPLGYSDPQAAEAATECALLVAEYCPDPLGFALAAWARGNWDMYQEPQQAIVRYQQALAGYRAAGDPLSIARLLTNLIFPLTECGRLADAEAAASEARALLQQRAEETRRFQMVLEQNAGWLLHNQGRYAEALASYARALELAYELDNLASAAEIQVNRTITLEVFGHIAEEETTLLASRQNADRHNQRLTVARIDLNLGELYAALGRPIEALRRLQAAHKAFVTLDNQMELASVLLAEAALFGWLGALREARRSYAQAHTLFAALGMEPQIGIALLRGAVVDRRAGRFRAASELLTQAATLWQQLKQPLWQASVRIEQAELALAQGDTTAALDLAAKLQTQIGESPALATQYRLIQADALALRFQREKLPADMAAARQNYEAAGATANLIGDRGLKRRALAGYAKLLQFVESAVAQTSLEAALAIDEATRQTLSSEELKAAFLSQRDDLLAPMVHVAAAQNDPQAALAAIWRIKGGALLDVMQMLDRSSAADHTVAQARERLAVLRWRRTLEAPLEDMPDTARELADPHIQAAEDELLRLLRQRQVETSDQRWPHQPLELLQRMGADLLIEYARCDGDLVAVRADRDGKYELIRLAPAADLAALIDDLQLHIQHVLSLQPAARSHNEALWLAECQPLLQALHAALIVPLGTLPAGAKLLIAPCDPIYLVPFAALYDGEQYLVQQHVLAMTPCGVLPGAAPASVSSEDALVVAATAEGRLGGVAAEVDAVARALRNVSCLYDQPGSIAVIQNRDRAPKILHIAAHSVMREDAPLFSALQLHGEMLSVEQCYDLPLRGTSLVTLSGCTTGAGLETGGSLLAFQTALFAAGAQAVLGSLWPIDDATTAEWMGWFYRFLAAGMRPEAALRQTQCEMIGRAGWQHPAVWAAWSCAMRYIDDETLY